MKDQDDAEEIDVAPKPLPTDENGNPIDFNYKGMVKEAKERKSTAAFKSKIKSISFTKVPGGARDRK